MVAAKTMSEAVDHFKDQLTDKEKRQLGSVVIGTVNGDLHDIGKNLVIMMLEGQGFAVVDLGVSVSTEKFVASVEEKKPDILAMSALLTTTLPEMKAVIDALKAKGLRDAVRIIVGGAPVTQDFADQIGADGYANNSPGAAQKRLPPPRSVGPHAPWPENRDGFPMLQTWLNLLQVGPGGPRMLDPPKMPPMSLSMAHLPKNTNPVPSGTRSNPAVPPCLARRRLPNPPRKQQRPSPQGRVV